MRENEDSLYKKVGTKSRICIMDCMDDRLYNGLWTLFWTQVWTGQSKILNVGEACAKIYMYIPMHLPSSTLVFIRLIAFGDTKIELVMDSLFICSRPTTLSTGDPINNVQCTRLHDKEIS